jgi:hypothetical protein
MSPPELAMTCRFIPVLLVLAGVERPVRGEPVDGNQGPVEYDAGVPGLLRIPDRRAQLRGTGHEQRDDLTRVPPGRGDPDPEPGRELGECLALAQVGEYQQDLLARVQLPPPRPDRLAVPADDPGDIAEGLGRQRVITRPDAPGMAKYDRYRNTQFMQFPGTAKSAERSRRPLPYLS